MFVDLLNVDSLMCIAVYLVKPNKSFYFLLHSRLSSPVNSSTLFLTFSAGTKPSGPLEERGAQINPGCVLSRRRGYTCCTAAGTQGHARRFLL